MPEPTTILGKIGKYTGEILADMQAQINGIDVNDVQGDVNVTGDIDGINLTATGDLVVGGHLECDSILVKGETKVVNTTTIEVSDNILEINKNQDGSARANDAGISVNRGTSLNLSNDDSFTIEEEDNSNNITGAQLTTFTEGGLGNEISGISQIEISINQITQQSRTLTYETGYKVIRDLYDDTYYSTRYEYFNASTGQLLALLPYFSLSYDSSSYFASGLNEDVLNATSVGYLRGWRLRHANEADLLVAVIRDITYSLDAQDKPTLIWQESSNDWSIKLGNNLAELNGVFHAQNGDGFIVNGENLGDYSIFQSYLEDSL